MFPRSYPITKIAAGMLAAVFLSSVLPSFVGAEPTPDTLAPESRVSNMLLKGGLSVSDQSMLPVAVGEGQTVIDEITLKNQSQDVEKEFFQEFPVSLTELIDLTLTRNIDVSTNDARITQSEGYLTQSFGTLLPSLSTAFNVDRTKGLDFFQPNPNSPDPNQRVGAFDLNRTIMQPRLTLSYPISLGLKNYYQIKTTQLQLKRAKEGKSQSVQQALLDSLSQYFTLLRDVLSVDTFQQSLKEATAQLKYSELRYKNGFATQLEVMQAKTLEATRLGELLKAENQKDNSSIVLASSIDLPINIKVMPDLPELVPLKLMDDSLGLDVLYERALNNRPDIRQQALLIEEAKARYGISRADLLPTINLSTTLRELGISSVVRNPQRPSGVQNVMGDWTRTNLYSASITWNILTNGGLSVWGDLKVNKGRIREAIANYEKQLNEMQRTLATAYQNTKLYDAQIGAAQQKMSAAQEGYRIALARFKNGIGVNLETIQAQKDYTDARNEYLTAVMNYNIAQLRMMYELGELSADNLLQKLSSSTP